MKISHRSGKPRMAEPFLHMQYVLPILQEMSCRAVPQFMDGDGMVEANSCSCRP